MTTSARLFMSEAALLDRAIYDAIAETNTPRIDAVMRRVSIAANYSRLSMTIAALLAATGGARGRRAAASGLVSVAATSAIGNLVIKPLGRRRRPDRTESPLSASRQVPMPGSRSFPSGHAAAAVAFASGVGREIPQAEVPLEALAVVVGYSRIHTGVHYPGDVLGGALIGAFVADVAGAVLTRLESRRRAQAG